MLGPQASSPAGSHSSPSGFSKVQKKLCQRRFWFSTACSNF